MRRDTNRFGCDGSAVKPDRFVCRASDLAGEVAAAP
jgi:hypothetical protein